MPRTPIFVSTNVLARTKPYLKSCKILAVQSIKNMLLKNMENSISYSNRCFQISWNNVFADKRLNNVHNKQTE